jgi:hypothetical protein
MKHLFLFFLLLYQSSPISGKRNCEGINSKRTACFCHDHPVDGSTTISDVDGKFSISSKKACPLLTFSLGYSKTTVPILKGKAITAFRSCVKEMI